MIFDRGAVDLVFFLTKVRQKINAGLEGGLLLFKGFVNILEFSRIHVFE